jgi:hypothetical protein
MSRAGLLTYAAFAVAQLLSTIIAVFGFNGYDVPREHVKACEFCRMSGGGRNAFFVTLNAPQAQTDKNLATNQLQNGAVGFFQEGAYTDSIVGCLAYAVVAWIWSFIWHIPLDGIKWAMAYILNEDGFRDRMHGRDPATLASTAKVNLGEGDGLGPAEGKPSVGRTSLGRTSLGRTSAGRPNIGRNSVQGAFIKGGGGTGAFGRMSAGPSDNRPQNEIQTVQGGPATWTNPTGRVSVQFAPGALERASVVSVPRRTPSVGADANSSGIQPAPEK